MPSHIPAQPRDHQLCRQAFEALGLALAQLEEELRASADEEDSLADPGEAFDAGVALEPEELLAIEGGASGVEAELLERCAVALQAVEPYPNASRLRALVSVAPTSSADEASAALLVLRSHVGWLRSELAQALHRKRVPELVIDLAPTSIAGRGRGA